MKKILTLVLAAVMVLSLSACSQSAKETTEETIASSEGSTQQEEQGERKTIALLVPNMGIGYFRIVSLGILEACERYGYDFVIKSGITSVDTQLQAIEDLVQSGVAGIVISPIDSYGLASAIDLCEENGVALISQANLYGSDKDATSVMATDNFKMGASIAEVVVSDLEGNGNVIILKGAPNVAHSEEKVVGMVEVFDQYPGIVVLEEKANADEDATGQTSMADLIFAYPDIDAVVCVNENGLIGAMISLEEAGYKLGEDVLTYSGNYASKLSKYIEDGSTKTGFFSFGNYFGAWSVEVIDDYVNGRPVPSKVNLPSTFVTKDNYKEFEALDKKAMDYDFDKVEDK
jgi:ribose transport system substrate-binding protein